VHVSLCPLFSSLPVVVVVLMVIAVRTALFTHLYSPTGSQPKLFSRCRPLAQKSNSFFACRWILHWDFRLSFLILTASCDSSRMQTMTDHGCIPIISDAKELLEYGVCLTPIPFHEEECYKLATELSQVTPMIMAEADGAYAFYKNILEEPDFPFDAILKSEIGKSIARHFGIANLTEIRLDDAFCVHYNMSQDDTSGAKHTDPSDITVNMCLEKSEDVQGSEVLFYGTQCLVGVENSAEKAASANFKFLVEQIPGYATIHWGHHPHETTALLKGRRTNIVLTYCYSDASRSDVTMRTCYS
jgi:hypothetical protein